MKKVIINILLQFIIFISLLSCTTTLNYSSKPDEGKAYLYGRFSMNMRRNATVGLAISNLDKKHKGYVIPLDTTFFFKRSKDIRAYAVRPGRYRIVSIQATINRPPEMKPDGKFTQQEYDYEQRDFTDSVFSREFTVEPGRRYYLGDFNGYSRHGGLSVVWGISKPADNYSATNAEFERLYVNLKRLPVVNVFGKERDAEEEKDEGEYIVTDENLRPCAIEQDKTK